MRILLGLSVVCCLIAAACSSDSLPTSRQLGILNIKDTTDGAGGYITRSTGVFWTAQNISLPNSRSTPDTCIVDSSYVPPDTTTTTLPNQLDAGSPIMQLSDLGTNTLTPDTIWGTLHGVPFIKVIVYRGGAAGLAHTPGADITFTIPGAAGGFPTSSVKGITAKRLILGPVDPNPTDSLHLTWVAGTPGLTQVQMQLLYNTKVATKPSRALLCSLYDDGSFWVNKETAAQWASGYGNFQTMTAFRFVTTPVPGPNSSLVVTIAEFDTVKTTFP